MVPWDALCSASGFCSSDSVRRILPITLAQESVRAAGGGAGRARRGWVRDHAEGPTGSGLGRQGGVTGPRTRTEDLGPDADVVEHALEGFGGLEDQVVVVELGRGRAGRNVRLGAGSSGGRGGAGRRGMAEAVHSAARHQDLVSGERRQPHLHGRRCGGDAGRAHARREARRVGGSYESCRAIHEAESRVPQPPPPPGSARGRTVDAVLQPRHREVARFVLRDLVRVVDREELHVREVRRVDRVPRELPAADRAQRDAVRVDARLRRRGSWRSASRLRAGSRAAAVTG